MPVDVQMIKPAHCGVRQQGADKANADCGCEPNMIYSDVRVALPVPVDRKSVLKKYDKLVNGSHCEWKNEKLSKLKGLSANNLKQWNKENTFIVPKGNCGRGAPAVRQLAKVSANLSQGSRYEYALTIADRHAVCGLEVAGQRHGDSARNKSSSLSSKVTIEDRSPSRAANGSVVSLNRSDGSLSPSRTRKAKTPISKENANRRALLKKHATNSSPRVPSPATMYGRISNRTATISPAPLKTQPIPTNRFGFRATSKSGDSTDSLNSILSDLTTSDSNFNLCESVDDNGNGPTIEVASDSSSCAISQASSGVTSALINSKLRTQPTHLPKPQIFSPLAKAKTIKARSKPSPPLKSKVLQDSGFGSSSEYDKDASKDVGNVSLDLSDVWLKEKTAFLGATAKPPKNDVDGNDLGKEKQHVVTYGMARQKIAPYNRKRYGFMAPSYTDGESNRIPNGSVRSRVAQLENTPKPAPKTSQSCPRKRPTRPLLDRTPGSPQNSKSEPSNTHRKLEYNKEEKLVRKKTCSPKRSVVSNEPLVATTSRLSRNDTQSKSLQTKVLSPATDSDSFILLTTSSTTSPEFSEIQDQVVDVAKSYKSPDALVKTASKSMEASSESLKWGKCSPVATHRDNDFFDDEISDQPALTFGDDLHVDLFDDLFPDDPITSPIRHQKAEPRRSRAESTSSSFGADDLMLDFDDVRNSNGCAMGSPKKMLEIFIPGGSLGSCIFEVSGESTNSITASLIVAAHDLGGDETTWHHNGDLCCLLSRLSKASKNGIAAISVLRLVLHSRYDEPMHSPIVTDVVSELSNMLAQVNDTQSCVSRESFGASTHASATASPAHSTATRTTSVPVKPRPLSLGPEPIVFKPPRQGGAEGDGVTVDRNTLHYMWQDVTSMKTLLLRLKRSLQVSDTVSPFETKNCLHFNAVSTDATVDSTELLLQQNAHLNTQVLLLEQQLEHRDQSIAILQQKLQTTQLASSQTSCMHCSSTLSSSSSNAATQTDRTQRICQLQASLGTTSSVDDPLGPTVSSESRKATLTNGHNHFSDLDNGIMDETSSCLVSSVSSSSSS